MNKKSAVLGLIAILTLGILTTSIAQDKAIYIKKKTGERERTILSLDFTNIQKPTSIAEMKPVFHQPPLRQDTTGTCWCFATTSFFESELKRLYGMEVKLSEIHTVYYEYLEKARRFVQEKGNSAFEEGSEHNAVSARMKQYGAVPESAYTGLLNGRTRHNHAPMYQEMRDYLDFVETHGYWDEEQVLTNIRLILNRYLGEPPKTVTVDGKILTPQEYLKHVLRLPLDDYVGFISTTSLPFYTQGEYKVPDNWWHSADYYNVPLDEFYGITKKAIQSGYSVDLGGDISEPGKYDEATVAIVPSFDIPWQDIDQSAREFRFYNKTSTDDHAVHLIGTKRIGDHDWFLIKDSARGAHTEPNKGYLFFRDDYIKLKILTFMVHKDMAADILKKFTIK